MGTLYEDLDVEQDASPEELKSAHRKAVQRTHPDKGGDREEFERVQKAWLVLSDPEKRDHYDRTGEAGDPAPDNSLSQIADIMTTALDAALGECKGQFETTDIVDLMTEFIETKIEEGQAANLRLAQNRVKVEKMRQRLSFDGEEGATDQVGRILEQRLQVMDTAQDGNNRIIEAHEKALEHIELYGWEVDAPPPMQWEACRYVQYGFPNTISMNPGA